MGKSGRPAAEATSLDGKLVARACEILGLTMSALVTATGTHKAILSRASSGELPWRHRDAINDLLKSKEQAVPISTFLGTRVHD